MPNWTTNGLKCSKRDSKLFLNEEGTVDFNKFRPMPESMNVEYSEIDGEKHLVSGGHNDADIDILYYLTERNTKAFDFMSLMPITWAFLKDVPQGSYAVGKLVDKCLERLKDMAEKYKDASDDEKNDAYTRGSKWFVNLTEWGVYDWYDWSCKYWGTKWNACRPEVSELDDGDVLIVFDTAWCMPHPNMLHDVFMDFEDDYVFESYDEDFNGVHDEKYSFLENPVIFADVEEYYKELYDEDEEEDEEPPPSEPESSSEE